MADSINRSDYGILNLFMLERIIEMVKGRYEEILVAFLDMEKAYDRVDRKKLFEVMRCYGVHEKLVRLIERIYDGSMVKYMSWN